MRQCPYCPLLTLNTMTLTSANAVLPVYISPLLPSPHPSNLGTMGISTGDTADPLWGSPVSLIGGIPSVVSHTTLSPANPLSTKSL